MKVTKKVHNEMAAIRRERSVAKAQAKASPAKKTQKASPATKTSGRRTAKKATPKTAAPKRTPKAKERDPRLPAVGTTLEREFKGKTIRVKITADGFEYEGEKFTSISAVARHITGYMISGPVFFKLVEPKRPEAK